MSKPKTEKPVKDFELTGYSNCDMIARISMTPKQAYRVAQDVLHAANSASNMGDECFLLTLDLKASDDE